MSSVCQIELFWGSKIATLNVTVTLASLECFELDLLVLYVLEMTPELTILLDLNTVEA